MSENTITILPAQMRTLARYEETFDKYIGETDFEDCDLAFPEKYRMTLDDLYTAVKNMLEKNPTVQEFGEHWFYPLSELEESFCIPEACGETDDEYEDFMDSGSTMDPGFNRVLMLTEEDAFCEVWGSFEDIWIIEDESDHLANLEIFKDCLGDIENFLANKDKPVTEREFTDHQKEWFISIFENDARVRDASELELELCRKFTDELCEKGSETALHLKGYSCYGGNRLYDCDWKASRDCMIRLYEKTDDPGYANTLGYIYYYGRCTGGVPEYEKAFEMFSVAAANGLYEGMYKLADMFWHGYACKKSPRTARALYGMVYEDCRKKLSDKDGSFADAALRMGNVYLKGIDEQVNPEEAYSYYLQADYAARRRAKDSDFFGNTTVAINIRKALEETKSALPKGFLSEYLSVSQPRIFWTLVEDGYRAAISFKENGDGSVLVKVERLPGRFEDGAKPILLTYPEISFCDLVTRAELTAFNLKTSFDLHAEKAVKYDSCNWNYADDRIEFYYDEDLVGWLSCDEYRIYPKNKEKPDGKELRLVSVAFHPGGRTYDYLCEIPDIQVGDKVIVNGYDGETEVEVLAVYSRYESELGLPVGRYKKVVRKA